MTLSQILRLALALTIVQYAAAAESPTVEEWGDTRCDLVAPENREPCIAAHIKLGIPPDKTRAVAAVEAAVIAAAETEAGEPPEIVRAKTLLEESLKDPTSVMYKDVVYVEEKRAVCGQFNAKNEFGGYSGFSKFTVGMDLRVRTYTGRLCNGVAKNLQMSCLLRERADIKAIQENCSSVFP